MTILSLVSDEHLSVHSGGGGGGGAGKKLVPSD